MQINHVLYYAITCMPIDICLTLWLGITIGRENRQWNGYLYQTCGLFSRQATP